MGGFMSHFDPAAPDENADLEAQKKPAVAPEPKSKKAKLSKDQADEKQPEPATVEIYSLSLSQNIDINDIIKTAHDAGRRQMEIYEGNTDDWEVQIKSDNSPLTAADRAADDIITEALKRLTPHIPIISEEQGLPPYEVRKTYQYFWCLDPLDGTKEFIKRNGQFTVNIGLVDNRSGQGKPIMGVVYVPAHDTTYYGIVGTGAFKIQDGSTKQVNVAEFAESDAGLTVVASASHRNKATNDFIEKYKDCKLKSMGSSLKLLLVAEGTAHVYPRIAPTSEWDTCAAHAVVTAAGGTVLQYGEKYTTSRGQIGPDMTPGEEVVYGKENILNPYFVVYGKRKAEA